MQPNQINNGEKKSCNQAQITKSLLPLGERAYFLQVVVKKRGYKLNSTGKESANALQKNGKY